MDSKAVCAANIILVTSSAFACSQLMSPSRNRSALQPQRWPNRITPFPELVSGQVFRQLQPLSWSFSGRQKTLVEGKKQAATWTFRVKEEKGCFFVRKRQRGWNRCATKGTLLRCVGIVNSLCLLSIPWACTLHVPNVSVAQVFKKWLFNQYSIGVILRNVSQRAQDVHNKAPV